VLVRDLFTSSSQVHLTKESMSSDGRSNTEPKPSKAPEVQASVGSNPTAATAMSRQNASRLNLGRLAFCRPGRPSPVSLRVLAAMQPRHRSARPHSRRPQHPATAYGRRPPRPWRRRDYAQTYSAWVSEANQRATSVLACCNGRRRSMPSSGCGHSALDTGPGSERPRAEGLGGHERTVLCGATDDARRRCRRLAPRPDPGRRASGAHTFPRVTPGFRVQADSQLRNPGRRCWCRRTTSGPGSTPRSSRNVVTSRW
jgi:hypothetical protein